MAILSVLSGLYTVYEGYSQSRSIKRSGRQAQQAAERNALLQESETAEEARRMGNLQEMEQDQAAALAAASGIDAGTGSMAAYLGEQKSEHGAQLDWLKKAGSMKAANIREAGRAAKKTSKYQARSAVRGGWMSGISSMVTSAAGSGAWG